MKNTRRRTRVTPGMTKGTTSKLFHVCSCKTGYTARQWKRLSLVRRDRELGIELRLCRKCGSTMGVEI